MKRGGEEKINIDNLLNDLKKLSKNNMFEEFKNLTLNFEKNILDNCKSEHDFKTLIDDITLYSDYSLLNTLLIRFQYPTFISLNTKKNFSNMGYNVSKNASPIKILTPINDDYISIKNHDSRIVKKKKDLTQEELKMYLDPSELNVTLDHREFKGLKIMELFDIKDTDMNKNNYDQEFFPTLFYSSYDEIYNSFVKAIYSEGYKVKYENIEEKISLNKNNKIISLKKGLNKQTYLFLLLDTFTRDNSSNDMEKRILDMAIARRIGIDNKEVEYKEFYNWYINQDMKDVDHLLKIIVSKGKRFYDNFIKFYNKELKEIEDLYPNEFSLYDDHSFLL